MFEKEYEELASKHYLISDIILPETRVIFLLESPHIQEIVYGAPVSGSSGLSMTKHIFGKKLEKYPFGRILLSNKNREKRNPIISRLGLMNVCNIPLQGSAYDEEDRNKNRLLIKEFEYIRINNQRDRFPSKETNEVQSLILGKLRTRLNVLKGRHLSFVPCGRFAQKFFRLAGVSDDNWALVRDIPHPSYNNWSKSTYTKSIQNLKNVIKREI
jgi:hypothetical protein